MVISALQGLSVIMISIYEAPSMSQTSPPPMQCALHISSLIWNNHPSVIFSNHISSKLRNYDLYTITFTFVMLRDRCSSGPSTQ